MAAVPAHRGQRRGGARVEVLAFARDLEIPGLADHRGAALYGADAPVALDYVAPPRTRVPRPDPGPRPLTWVAFKLVHAGDARPIAARGVRLRLPSGVELERQTAEDGTVRFVDLPAAGTVDVSVLGDRPPGGHLPSVDATDAVDDPTPAPPRAARPEEAALAPPADDLEVAEDLEIEPEPPEPPEPGRLEPPDPLEVEATGDEGDDA
jgi:hypothetical protein